jgi:hypothetical protein
VAVVAQDLAAAVAPAESYQKLCFLLLVQLTLSLLEQAGMVAQR